MLSRYFSPDDRASLPVLLREVGLLDALRLGLRVKAAVNRGEPYLGWSEPADAKERDSRAQIGAAILLYRELNASRGQAEALRITREVVVEAACAQLRRQIGPLRRQELERLAPEERETFARERGDKFVNADMVWGDINATGLSFTVTRCRFPAICATAGVPELSPVFCAGDAKFFGTIEPEVELLRGETIAEGAGSCGFEIRFIRTPHQREILWGLHSLKPERPQSLGFQPQKRPPPGPLARTGWPGVEAEGFEPSSESVPFVRLHACLTD